MMKIQNRLFAPILVFPLLYPTINLAEDALVVTSQNGCDYFVADGKRGLYLLSWYEGYRPSIDDVVVGDIGSYGTKHVYYPNRDKKGRVCVEEYFLSDESAMKQLKAHCN